MEIHGVVHAPSAFKGVGPKRFMNGPITGYGIHFGHPAAAAFELKVKAELVNRGVVEKIERHHKVIGTVHTWNDLAGRVENGPVEEGPRRYIGIDVDWSVGVGGQELACSGFMTQGWTGPVGLRGRSKVDVVDKPIIATGAAAAGLMNPELRIGMECCCREHGHKLGI